MRTVRCSGRLVGGGRSAWRGLYLGVESAQRGVGVSARGGSAQGGVCLWVGVCLEGVSKPAPALDRIRDACENITFPQLLLRTVKREY